MGIDQTLLPRTKDEVGIVTTRLDEVVRWGRKNSLWPLPFGTACCAIEFMGAVSSKFDISRFGAELVRFSPRQADLILVAGTINYKLAPVLKRIYDQMAEPKYVISMGVVAPAAPQPARNPAGCARRHYRGTLNLRPVAPARRTRPNTTNQEQARERPTVGS